MKMKITAMSAMLAVSLGLNNCLVTDLAFDPPGSVDGATVKANASTAALMGALIGCEVWAAMKTKPGVTIDCSKAKNYTMDLLTVYLLAPATANINPSETYTAASAEACTKAIGAQAQLMTIMLLPSLEQLTDAKFDEGFLMAGILAGGACKLQETGEVISVGPAQL